MAIKTIKSSNLSPGNALTAGKLSQFAATTSAELAGVISDETGTGKAVFSDDATLVRPVLGTPASGTLSNCTFPTLNQNTTGTASNVTGIVASANGGTGLALTSAVIKVSLGSPAVSVTTAVATAQAIAGEADLTLDGTLAAAGVVTFVTARNTQAVSTDAADTTQTLHIVGTNILNLPMSETLALNGLTPVIGKKAFKTITQVHASAACTGNISVGNSTALGLPFQLTAKSDLVGTWFNDILEATLPTIALGDATAVSATTGDTRGTLILNSTLDGSAVAVYLNVYTLNSLTLYGLAEYSA
jgi:hypothetical protein